MKAFAILTAGLLGLATLTASAQTSPSRQASDPSYSRHNYKHPQKAAVAKAEDDQTLSASTFSGMEGQVNPVATRRNYKAQDRNRKRTDALLILPGKPVERNTNPLTSPDNYKRQQQPAPKAKKPAPLPEEPMVNSEGAEQQ